MMPQDFQPIPQWFSWENQGAGIAVADLGGGQQHLAVLMVDKGAPQNRGLYRIGRGLNAQGAVTGGWTDWFDVPDWFSWENQGADVAVADLDGDGRPELIVFMIDNPAGQNQGYYRVGRKLDADGIVTGGWGDWTPIPDWFSFENEHGGIAVADLDRDGRPVLIVFMIDNPAGKNEGFFRIGRKLDAGGVVTGGWSDWQKVPDWFSFENQAGNIAVADLGAGTTDIVVYQIDNPLGLNQGFYKVGNKLDVNGHVQGGWGLWTVLPRWFSFENAGGGVAVMDFAGKHKLIPMFVDNPIGQNAGLYRVLDLDADPPITGSWTDLKFSSEVLAVHAAVLHTGKVMFFAGSGNVQQRHDSPDFGSIDKKIYTSVVWDPAVQPTPTGDENFFHPVGIKGDNGKVFDFFCGGDSFLADGRLLSAGGTLAYPGHVSGRADAVMFNPVTQHWARAAHMAHGRWYPTLLTLGDGRILTVSGLSEDGNLNQTVEVYSPSADNWQTLHPPADFPGLPLYAHLFLMADGRILFTGGSVEGPAVPIGPCLLDIAHGQIAVAPLANLSAAGSRKQSASVLLPPVQDQKAMIIGGGVGDEGIIDATAAVDIIDLKAPHPQFQPAAPMNLPRTHVNATLLPDRTVLVTGGGLARESRLSPTLQSEIYDPATNTWTLVASSRVPRLYHSVALLLPDGRVVVAGGNPAQGRHVEWGRDPENEEMRLDVYSPPYLFKGPRPVITAAAEEWHYAATVDISCPQAGSIRSASLVRNGVTTHSFNTGQRLVDLPITAQGTGTLKATVTNEPNLAPPGWYMLFLVNQQGVPSVAEWIHLT
ncbi:MAG: hypothetical protein QOG73_3274 [Acetobacteraceae bacterium]|nr:hypothetical protein [Acetobacteraceae bacterium]